MDKLIIGLVGEIASGKSTIAQFLEEEFGSLTVSFSESLRKILDIFGLPQSRENMVWLGVDLRERFGQHILAQAVFKIINESWAKVICLPNIRLESDITLLKTWPGFVLVSIKAEQKSRYQRLIKRGQNTDDATKTWEKFLTDSQLPTEITIREVAKGAKFSIDNNTSLTDLFSQVREIIEKVRGEIS